MVWHDTRGLLKKACEFSGTHPEFSPCPKTGPTINSGCVPLIPMKFETTLGARAAVQALAASKIRELYNEGIGRKNILVFWVGEPDEPTPEFICKAATELIGVGELFYTHNFGIPELREALVAYITRLHRTTDPNQIAVAS